MAIPLVKVNVRNNDDDSTTRKAAFQSISSPPRVHDTFSENLPILMSSINPSTKNQKVVRCRPWQSPVTPQNSNHQLAISTLLETEEEINKGKKTKQNKTRSKTGNPQHSESSHNNNDNNNQQQTTYIKINKARTELQIK